LKHYIYLITNNINQHKYVGQTTNLKKRWSEHSRPSRNFTTIEKAFKKYGKENFSLDILEIVETNDKANEREIYWIDYYNTFHNPKNYNCHIGGNIQSGENNPMYGRKGENCPLTKLNKNIGIKIYNEYKQNSQNTLKTLSKKFNLSTTTIAEICSGEHWTTQNMNNIIRKNDGENRSSSPDKNICIDIYNLYKRGKYNIIDLEKQYGLDYVTIRKICKGIHWSTKGFSDLMTNLHTSSKITKQVGQEIYQFYINNKLSIKEIFNYFKDKYDISFRTIQRICYGNHWSIKI
jgi:group I intron endonuclease